HAALLANPDHPDFIWLHADSLRLRGRSEEVLAFLNRHAPILEASAELLNVKASVLSEEALANRTDQSKISITLDTFVQARQLDPENVDSYLSPGVDRKST